MLRRLLSRSRRRGVATRELALLRARTCRDRSTPVAPGRYCGRLESLDGNEILIDSSEKWVTRLRLRKLTDNLALVDESDPEQSVLRLLEMEVAHRDRVRVDRTIKTAGLCALKSLEDFRFDEVTLPAALTPEDLTSLRFIDDRENLILHGNVGTGETHLATALGIEACKAGRRVAFYRTAALAQSIPSTVRKRTDTISDVFHRKDDNSWNHYPFVFSRYIAISA